MRAWTLAPALVVLSWGVAEACKCAVDPTADEALALADAVFVGTVVDQRSYLNVDGACTGPAIEYDVVVHRAWKGVSEARLSLRRVSVCATSFNVGETSLIYALRDQGSLVASGCLRTRPIDRAAEDVAQFGAPAITFAGAARPVATSLPPSRWIRAHAVAGIGVYAFHYVNREWNPPPLGLILRLAAAAPFAIAAAVAFARRRRRAARWLAACCLVTLAAAIFWTGHVHLSSEWTAPHLQW